MGFFYIRWVTTVCRRDDVQTAVSTAVYWDFTLTQMNRRAIVLSAGARPKVSLR